MVFVKYQYEKRSKLNIYMFYIKLFTEIVHFHQVYKWLQHQTHRIKKIIKFLDNNEILSNPPQGDINYLL